MTNNKTPAVKAEEITDQELDQAAGGATSNATATVEPTYTLFYEDGKPARSADSVLGKRIIAVDISP